MDWSKYDKQVDLQGLKEDMKEARENGTSFKEVPEGQYEVTINKMEVGVSKTDKPMLIIWFKILEGEFKNSMLFCNKVLMVDKPFTIVQAEKILTDIKGEDVEFESYSQFAQLVDDLANEVVDEIELSLEHKIVKNFGQFEILEVFDA